MWFVGARLMDAYLELVLEVLHLLDLGTGRIRRSFNDDRGRLIAA